MSAPLLEIRNLTHRFGGLTAVYDFSLAVAPCELVGVIGPNGAGKTTVFNLISGVYRASAGSIRLDGEELVGRSPHAIARLGVGRSFRNIRLFRDLPVLDNVLRRKRAPDGEDLTRGALTFLADLPTFLHATSSAQPSILRIH